MPYHLISCQQKHTHNREGRFICFPMPYFIPEAFIIIMTALFHSHYFINEDRLIKGCDESYQYIGRENKIYRLYRHNMFIPLFSKYCSPHNTIVSMLTHTYPHKPLRKTKLTICNHQADSPLYVWPDI